MLKVFQKIRKKLLKEGKLQNYLLYAFGEVLLIVIGILIALAINNSNQDRIVKKNEQIYLNGLRTEFQKSQFKLNELIEVNKGNYKGAKRILEYISNPNEPPTEKTFSQLLLKTFYSDIYFNPNNSLLNEMINSGSIKDISNPELRLQLTNWLSTLEDISKQEYDLEIQRGKILDMFRSNEYSVRTLLNLSNSDQETVGMPKSENYKSNLHILKSTEFENNLFMFILTSRATEEAHYYPLMDDLNFVLELINAELL